MLNEAGRTEVQHNIEIAQNIFNEEWFDLIKNKDKHNPPTYNKDQSKRFNNFFNEGKLYSHGYVGSTFKILLEKGYDFEVKT